MSTGYLRWTPDEYRGVAIQAIQFLEKGVHLPEALGKAQRLALTKLRHKSPEDLLKTSKTKPCLTAVEAARALGPEKLATLYLKVERTTLQAQRRNGRGGSAPGKWTQRELALLARAVKRRIDAGDTSRLALMYSEVQEQVLDDPARWRTLGALRQAQTNKTLHGFYDEGVRHIWVLGEEETKPEPVAEPVQAVAQAPAEPVAVPTPLPLAAGPLADAAKAFADTMQSAMASLLQASAMHTLQGIEARISTLAADIGAGIAAQIERGLRGTVMQTIAQELGGPVTPPADPVQVLEMVTGRRDVEPPAPMPEPPAPPRQQLKVDVVGLTDGALEQKVRGAFNGGTDIRFVSPDDRTTYKPHRNRHCIIITQRIPHALRDKIKAANVEPIYVRSTPGHVVHAIEELHRAHAIPL